ncbi:MAG: hypothetical protein OJF51_002894 [Nitrospira sp.]|nr:MAG: hypothetical protein OJF51_002894 [Nitrospira sp.]
MIRSDGPRNIQIIRQCLEMWFSDVTPSTLTERFIYHDGTQTSELALDREFVDHLAPEQLQGYMENTVLPTFRASPGKVIRAGADGITIRARQTH